MADFTKWDRFDADAAEEELEKKGKIEESKRAKVASEERAVREAQCHADTLKSKASVEALKTRQQTGGGRRRKPARDSPVTEGDQCQKIEGTGKVSRLQQDADKAGKVVLGLREGISLRNEATSFLEVQDYSRGSQSAQAGLKSLRAVQEVLKENNTKVEELKSQSLPDHPKPPCPGSAPCHSHGHHDKTWQDPGRQHHPRCHAGDNGCQAVPADPPDEKWKGRADGGEVLNVVQTVKKDCAMTEAACFLGASRIAEATETLRDLLFEDAQHVPAWVARGEAFQAMGNPMLAELHFERALSFEPENPSALKHLERLR
ncbi:unnamed protein product, partial [Choristocarpus tenellus]